MNDDSNKAEAKRSSRPEKSAHLSEFYSIVVELLIVRTEDLIDDVLLRFGSGTNGSDSVDHLVG